jgi:hypothetical protein
LALPNFFTNVIPQKLYFFCYQFLALFVPFLILGCFFLAAGARVELNHTIKELTYVVHI